jgi:hypothetical protein
MSVGKDEYTITQDPQHRITNGSMTNKELVTVGEAISGSGHSIPPLVILQGIVFIQNWFISCGLPSNWVLGVSDIAYSNDEIALSWLKHFDQHTSIGQYGAKRLLLLDGHGSHCTIDFVNYASSKDILLFCMIPHTTHLCQPLDVVVFQPYKH